MLATTTTTIVSLLILVAHARVGACASAPVRHSFVWQGEEPIVPGPPAGYAVAGLKPGALDAVHSALDEAARHGLLLQIVLSTAHFLRYGYGGEGGVLHEITNRDRVANNHALFATPQGNAAYVRRVLQPLLQRIGKHPALFGFLIVNEGEHLQSAGWWLVLSRRACRGARPQRSHAPLTDVWTLDVPYAATRVPSLSRHAYSVVTAYDVYKCPHVRLVCDAGYSMVQKEDALGVLTRTTDVTIPLKMLQRFVNTVAGAIRRTLPGAILSASLKLRRNSRWLERNGVAGIGRWYSDALLIESGGDTDGTLDIDQWQYYPESCETRARIRRSTYAHMVLARCWAASTYLRPLLHM